jgi:hypothetical protein
VIGEGGTFFQNAPLPLDKQALQDGKRAQLELREAIETERALREAIEARPRSREAIENTAPPSIDTKGVTHERFRENEARLPPRRPKL